MEQEVEDGIVVAASTIFWHTVIRPSKRKIWVKDWLMEREILGAYNALLVKQPHTAMDDYKRFMRMDEDTFKVKAVNIHAFL